MGHLHEQPVLPHLDLRLVVRALALCGLVGAAVRAQEPPRFQPPPDHWLTLDSLTQLVELSADQRAKVAESY